MKFPSPRPYLRGLLLLLGSSFGFALDRNAFSFVNYSLQVRVTPAQQGLAASGRITLRNDSLAPQRHAVLQISSTLDWRSIRSRGKLLEYLTQPYISDIDHTGTLSEAVITLPRDVPPQGTVELEIAYNGAISASSGRLDRIGTPAAMAAASDWDVIGENFSAVRGVGYVVWYPVAIESASLSEGNKFFELLGAWKARHEQSNIGIQMCLQSPRTQALTLIMNGAASGNTAATAQKTAPARPVETCIQRDFRPLGVTVPTFAIAGYRTRSDRAATVYYLPEDESGAADYTAIASRLVPFTTEWFGAPRQAIEIIELPDPKWAPFESGPMLFTPLHTGDVKSRELTVVHQLVHASFVSARPWIYEGLAHFAQALYREQQEGRKAAITYMDVRLPALMEIEKQIAASQQQVQAQSLVGTWEETFYRSKAMFVWWMLRDMVGDQALKRGLAAYRSEQDREPSYMQKLIEQQSKRSLEWFFDDWVYRDRGLPDFYVDSVYPRATLGGGFVVTVTVGNLGAAGAPVPVTVRAAGGEIGRRIEVAAKAKAVVRIELPATPTEATVNDGSVPESNMSNNSAAIPNPQPDRKE